MKIKNIKIQNFRSLMNVNIEFNNIMMFIGQNNHGKSNILYALLFFFGELKLQNMDFFNGTEELFVEIEFNELNVTDQITFKKYLTSTQTILVRKTGYIDGNFEYKGYIQNPINEYLQESNASSYAAREVASQLPFYDLLPSSGRLTKDMIIQAQQTYIEANQEDIEFNYELETNNFLGLKSVAKGIFGDVFFIPAIKNINDDLSNTKNSLFTQLYTKVIDLITTNHTTIGQIKQSLSDQFSTFKKYDVEGNLNVLRPTELGNFETKLSSNLHEWGVDLEVEITPPNIDEMFKTNVNIWVHDGIKTDITRKGHGLQRALTFSLIKTLSETLQDSNSNTNTTNRQSSNSLYFIFEEPELYLHPQAQRSLLESLKTLSTDNQVILCTHSSALISLENYQSIAIVRKNLMNNQTSVSQFMGELFTNDERQNFNLLSWINPDRAELFFAKKVILVEGATEKTVIPYLAKRLGIFKFEYTLIDCGSKSTISQYINLLNKFSIPYIAVYDRDHQAHKGPDAIVTADRESRKIEDAILTSIGNSIILENDIEEELGMVAGTSNKPYIALKTISTESFSIPSQLQLKISQIYS